MRRRTGFPASVLELVAGRSGGVCEVQWCCDGAPAAEYHHRRPRGAGGTRRESASLASNCLHACAADHAWIESNREYARDRGWLIPQGEDFPETVPVVYRGRRCLLEDDGTVVVIPE